MKTMTFKEFYKLRCLGLDDLKRFHKDIDPHDGAEKTLDAWNLFDEILHHRLKHRRIKQLHDDIYPACGTCAGTFGAQMVNWSPTGFMPGKDHMYYHVYACFDFIQWTMRHYQILACKNFIRTSGENPCLECGETQGDCLRYGFMGDMTNQKPCCINHWKGQV